MLKEIVDYFTILKEQFIDVHHDGVALPSEKFKHKEKLTNWEQKYQLKGSIPVQDWLHPRADWIYPRPHGLASSAC